MIWPDRMPFECHECLRPLSGDSVWILFRAGGWGEQRCLACWLAAIN